MKTLSILALAILLTACGHNPVKPEQPIAKQVEYVIKVPPADTMQLPQKPAKIDTSDPNLKQSNVARWQKASEEYTAQLENKLIEIAKFFTDEQTKLNEKAKQENK